MSCILCIYSPNLCIGEKRLLSKAKVKCWLCSISGYMWWTICFENKLDFMSLRLNFLISLYKFEKLSKFPEGYIKNNLN